MNTKRLLPLWMLVLALIAPAAALAENEGLADLDKATERKLSASSLADLVDVITQAERAMQKGLDKENTEFAEQLVVSTLVQRASLMAGAIMGENGPDPRWQQLRAVAIGDLERATKLDPKQFDAHLLVAKLQILPGGNTDSAKDALKLVIEAKDDAPPETRIEALTIRAGIETDNEKRLADFNTAIEIDPKSLPALRGRGLAYLMADQAEKARVDLQAAVDLDAESGPSREALGMALFMLEKYDDALAQFNKAIEINPNSAQAYLNRGRVRAVKKEFKEGLADLDKTLDLVPSAVPALLIRAQLRALNDDEKGAMADVEEALRTEPSNATAQRFRAQLLAGDGKLDEAISGLERLQAIDPKDKELATQLAQLYMADKKPRLAIRILDDSIKADPGDWKALRLRGDCYLSLGDHAKAFEDLNAAHKLSPDDSGILNNLAWLLSTSPDEKVRDGKRAVELATKACEKTEFKAPHILSTLAAAYAESGDFAKAREWSQKSIDVNNENEDKETAAEQGDQLKKELDSYKADKPTRELQDVEKEAASSDKSKPDDKTPSDAKPEDAKPNPDRPIDF